MGGTGNFPTLTAVDESFPATFVMNNAAPIVVTNICGSIRYSDIGWGAMEGKSLALSGLPPSVHRLTPMLVLSPPRILV